MPTCKFGCGKPTWNGQADEFCSSGCKTLFGEMQAKLCLGGCGKPSWNRTENEWCSSACRNLHQAQLGSRVSEHGPPAVSSRRPGEMSQAPLLPTTSNGQEDTSLVARQPSSTSSMVLEEKCDPTYALQLDNVSAVNVWLCIGACTYASMCVVLLCINWMQCKKPQYDIFGQGCPYAPLTTTSDNVHRMEFTSAFFFNCVNLLIVAYSSNKAKFQNPGLFKTWAFMNLLFSSTSMILIWAYRPLFEVPCHQMEYTAEISMTFLEMKLLAHGIQSAGLSPLKKKIAGVLNWIPSLLAVLQICIFNFGGFFFWFDGVKNWEGDCSFWGYQFNKLTGDTSCTHYGDAGGEWYGHCLEYIVGIMNALQAFFIAVDNKIDADRDLQRIINVFNNQAVVPYSNQQSDTMAPMPPVAEGEEETIRELEDKNRKLEREITQLRARR